MVIKDKTYSNRALEVGFWASVLILSSLFLFPRIYHLGVFPLVLLLFISVYTLFMSIYNSIRYKSTGLVIMGLIFSLSGLMMFFLLFIGRYVR